MSDPEAGVELVALYHPDVEAISEGRVLSIEPSPHPLSDHPKTRGMDLPPFRGTVDVASRLGLLKYHPTFVAEIDGVKRRVPYPLLGDVLLSVNDAKGLFCVNWPVKASAEDFGRPFGPDLRRARSPLAKSWAIARTAIETEHYSDAHIRTIQISQDRLDWHVAGNLRQLFKWHARKVTVDDETRQAIERDFEAALAEKVAPLELFPSQMRRHRCDLNALLAVLYQAIWYRRLRVDLFKPVLPNRPLRAEVKDVLVEYAHWFQRWQ